VCALTGETFVQNGRGRDAIDVIVTVDDHELLIFDGLLDTDDSLVHIAVALDKRLLAVHHTHAGHLAQGLHISSSKSHLYFLL